MSKLLNPGELFSGCKILHPCGRGAYGVVYLAENAIGHQIFTFSFRKSPLQTDMRHQSAVLSVKLEPGLFVAFPDLFQKGAVGGERERFFAQTAAES